MTKTPPIYDDTRYDNLSYKQVEYKIWELEQAGKVYTSDWYALIRTRARLERLPKQSN